MAADPEDAGGGPVAQDAHHDPYVGSVGVGRGPLGVVGQHDRRLERVYREAASALLKLDDLREVVGRRELYRRFSRVSETLIEAADRVWYATVKEG